MNSLNKLAETIIKEKDLTDPVMVSALFDIGRNENDISIIRKALNCCRKNIRDFSKNNERQKELDWHEMYKKMLLFASRYDFDSYLLYVESQRPPQERFYYPRRKVLYKAVKAMQALADGDLDELFLSMPPRVGKTTLVLFFNTWIIGKYPEKSNLYSAFSDTITQAFYNGVLEIINDPITYLWNDVFPNCQIANTNAALETLDINRKKRYPSITCRSLYGTLNGACDCNGILTSDDLIGGIEEALNKNRLDSAWSKVDNNLIPRAKETAKKLWIGTRWSLADPAGRRMELLKNDIAYSDVRFEIINLSALDEDENSNFDYMFDLGFSSEYYKQRRASFERNNDLASWLAQYMGEPIERQGTLFTPETMNWYNGTLPEAEPDRIFAFCDVAFGGGDYLSFPIAYQYGDRVFIHDVVFSNGDKAVTQPLVVNKIISNNVQSAEFELNMGGEAYAEDISQKLQAKDFSCNIIGKHANTHKRKEFRIFEKAPEIREFYFISQGHRTKEYELFIQNLFSFVMEGKNAHDDAPDSLAGLAEMKETFNYENVSVIERPF